MPTRDNTSDQRVVMAMNSNITGNTDTTSEIIDTADFDMGVMFASALQAFTDGAYAFAISESDDAGMAGATVVGAEKIIESLPTLDTAITALNAQWKVFGVHSTKRYLQITVTSTGVTTGAQVVVAAIMKGEYSPQSRV